MSEDTLAIQLDPTTRTKLAALAQSTQRSEALLAAEAVAAYVAQEDRIAKRIEAAVEHANSPDATWFSHDEVMAEIDKKIETALN